ncbi:DUF2892 domain-containing protein [uncultured Flavobacterium sp.]|uniref:YgaP family membrane protein n=1 Tax=uncultured Flavobacterium sp. TaxID=165435 RepID=UPI0030EEFEF6|tara:strand:- start:18847 stop:19062 length:216 start_codon:yes stop_codon:yes gene_type:complete
MKKNIGNGDRFFRIMIGIIALILVMGNVVEGTLMWIALAVGVIMVATSSLQFCPLYTLFGFSTCKVKPKKK